MTSRSNESGSFGTLLKQFRTQAHFTQQHLAEAIGMHRHAILRWEQGKTLPGSRAMVLEVARHLRLTNQQTQQLFDACLTLPAPLWGVPMPRHLFFTGREDILAVLEQHLRPDPSRSSPPVGVLCGLAGVGKTQTALEYAYRQAFAYRAIFWIEAETTERVLFSLQRIARWLALPEHAAPEQQRMVEAVHHWLATHDQWLLIADNVEDLDLLRQVWPPHPLGALLLTTRHQTLEMPARQIELAPLGMREGMLLLLRRAKRLEPATADEQGKRVAQGEERIDPATYATAARLVTLLGGLPLALDQAGAYLEETGCSLRDYLHHYQQHQAYLLGRRGGPTIDHPQSLVTTFGLAQAQIERTHVEAAELLRACTFLYPEAIPEELFTTSPGKPELLGATLAAFAGDPPRFEQALAALRNLSLVQHQAQTQTFSLHRLVQVVLRDQMKPADVRLWSERVICLVHAVFPDGDFGTWERCERYLAHALACVPLSLEQDIAGPEAGELFQRVGHYLLERGRFEEARPLLEHAVQLGERQEGSHHPILVPRLTSLAEYAWRRGDYAQAERVMSRVLSIEEQQPGTTDDQIGGTFGNLALLSWEQGKYAQAERLFHQALRLKEAHFGPLHLEISTTLNNLALLSWKLGKYAQAERFYQRALRIKEQAEGLMHPDAALSLSNLATLYRDQGKYAQAEALFQRALQIQRETIGSVHSEMALTLTNLGVLYCHQTRYEQAEALFQQALQIQSKTLSPTHRQKALSLANLAVLYTAQGKYEQAGPLFRQALHIQEQTLGVDHPDTATTLCDLATLLARQQNDEEAEALYQRALHIQEQALGAEHPQIARILRGLAYLTNQHGAYQQAAILYQRALHIQEHCLDAAHLEKARTQVELAEVYTKLGETTRATSLLQHARSIFAQHLGPGHPGKGKTRGEASSRED